MENLYWAGCLMLGIIYPAGMDTGRGSVGGEGEKEKAAAAAWQAWRARVSTVELHPP